MQKKERRTFLEDGNGGEPPRKMWRNHAVSGGCKALIALAGLLLYHIAVAGADTGAAGAVSDPLPIPWYEILTPFIITTSLILASCSFFFSASEVAFLSLNKIQLRILRESESWSHVIVSKLLEKPGSLLTTILMGNTIVNVLLSITFAEPVAGVMHKTFLLSGTPAYVISVFITTSLLLFFCETLPKIIAAGHPQTFSLVAAAPMYFIEALMTPFRIVSMTLVGYVFKITRLSQVPPAVFLTDDEFKTLLSDGEASGVIEEDERQMIQGILEFQDVTLREILSPRPDIVAIRESATVGEALDVVREHEYSRMPVYRDDLDHIIGILYAKDLLPVTEDGDMSRPVTQYMRRPHFVPETMSVSDFVSMAQRMRIHIAIVVDEYGGTDGLVTLQDALREVVGDIGEENDLEPPLCVELPDGSKRIAGNFPLADFEEMMGIASEDEQHMTIGGFLMAQSDKILEPGDELEYQGLHFRIEEVREKRVTLIQVTHQAAPVPEE